VTRVYQFAVQDGFEWVLPYEIFRKFDGTPRRNVWTPIRVRLLHEDEDKHPLAESDIPWLGAYAPVLRSHALEAVGNLLAEFGELLPLSSVEAELHVFNALRVVDALDLQRSDVDFFPNSNRIMRIARYAFVGDLVRQSAVFKVPQLLSHSVYLSGEAVRAIQAAHLKGVGFRLLWDDSEPG
jgi:hypothetical protein